MTDYRFLYVLGAVSLPSCVIYDESLLVGEDDNASVGGSAQDDDGSGGDGIGSGVGGSGGAPVVGGGGTGGSGPATGGANASGGSATGGSSQVCDGSVGTTGAFTGVGATKLIEDFNVSTKYLQDGADASLTGSWFVGVDASGGNGIAPANDSWVYQQDPCLTAGNKSMRVGGAGYVGWGASFDAALKNPAANFDASAYKGVVYWARVGSGGQEIKVAFSDADGPVDTTPKTLTTEWTQYKADFPAAIDTTKLRLVQIVAVGRASFDFWVDDLTFYQVP